MENMEPSYWPVPARPALGAALLKSGEPSQAEKVFREDLRRWPRNGRSLFGLEQSLLAQGKSQQAEDVPRQFQRSWKTQSEKVIELHGNIHRTKCFQEGTVVETWAHSEDLPPKCPRCAGPLRPDVVWFEEPLPEEAITQASNASRSCEAFLCIGTSSVVYPAAALPVQALKAGATVIEINPQPTPLTSRAHFVLPGAAGEILPLIVESLA